MKYISFCSGIESATVAWEPLNWTPVAFCEIDKSASRVLAHHYPDVPNLGDFTAVDWSKYSADICVGGTPCQAFSVAGLRKSLADERGNLSLEFIRAINTIRPRFVVWENVPGVLSTADNAFGCFLAGLVGCEEPIVFEQGWPNAGVVDGPIRRCAWRVLDAQYFGLAQRRKRVFVVASSGDGPHPAEILFEWESMRRDSPPRREAGEGTSRGIEIGPSGGGFTDVNPTLDSRCKDGPIRNQLAGPVAMCLNAKGGGGRIDAESETFVTAALDASYGRLQGCSGQDSNHGHSHLVTHSLRADGIDASEDGTGRGTPLVVAFDCKASGQSGFSVGEIASTLRSMGHTNSHQNGGGHQAVAIQAGALRENPNSGPDGVGVQEGIAYTLEARAEVQAVGCANTLNGNSGRMQVESTYIPAQMAVRRLTPRECERLQGFPDDYTLINGMADGPRYKMLGNSFAVPVVAWIGRRIQESQC